MITSIVIVVFVVAQVTSVPTDRGLLGGYHQVFNYNVTNSTITAAPSFIPTTEINEIDLDQPWSCGTDLFTMSIAEGTIEHDCPELKNVINNCCVAHDDCYDDQSGRDFCDNTFCNCLQNVTISNKQCNEDDGPAFCSLVRSFGEGAYIAAGMNTTTPNYDEDTMPSTHNLTEFNEYYDEVSRSTNS